MKISRKMRLGMMLVESGLITEEQLGTALLAQKETKKKLGETLLDLGFISEEQLTTELSIQMRVEKVSLRGVSIDEELVRQMDGSLLRKYNMIPYAYKEGSISAVKLAMTDPMDMDAIDDFTIVTNLQPDVVIASPKEITMALDKYFGHAETMEAAREYAKERELMEAAAAEEETKTEDVSNSPIVVLVQTMMEQAARQRASDIHIEALETRVRVRFRIDGVLYEKFSYDIRLVSAIIARIKVIGGMDISEKRKPQDGAINIMVDRVEYDIRASVLPTLHGEKCVMRLTQKRALTRDKKDLGFSPEEMETFDGILKNTNGILLVTGPTGSGKSTTLYTALSELNREDVNIVTVEDPVEADLDGINQVQVNAKANMTFASALRSILRQDPDIIMIGEIRDGETAGIAVQASMTGHLVVSTLHTNSSASTITRLQDIGVEKYLIADTVIGVIAQRLVRRLCPECKRERLATEEEKEFMNIDVKKDVKVFESVGCPNCNETGYYGRIGIYEIMKVTPTLRRVIARGGNTEEIAKQALSEGMNTIRMSAVRHVLSGTTSVQEAIRVTYEN